MLTLPLFLRCQKGFGQAPQFFFHFHLWTGPPARYSATCTFSVPSSFQRPRNRRWNFFESPNLHKLLYKRSRRGLLSLGGIASLYFEIWVRKNAHFSLKMCVFRPFFIGKKNLTSHRKNFGPNFFSQNVANMFFFMILKKIFGTPLVLVVNTTFFLVAHT